MRMAAHNAPFTHSLIPIVALMDTIARRVLEIRTCVAGNFENEISHWGIIMLKYLPSN